MPDESLADILNRDCHCIGVDSKSLQQSLEAGFGERGAYARLRESHPNLLAETPIFVSREHIDKMQDVVDAIEHVVTLESYQDHVLKWAPGIASAGPAAPGVFFGYDFHLTESGPRLIEINTNAGGALLLQHVAAAQQACCRTISNVFAGQKDTRDVEHMFVNMFQDALVEQRPTATLRTIAIVDEDPQTQYLLPEFTLFQQLFAKHGVEAVIADPRDFELRSSDLYAGGQRIDLVYNRLTDFYLQSDACTTLREACESHAAVFTPGPHNHALYANKKNLTVLCDEGGLRHYGASPWAAETLSTTIPRTVSVTADNANELWADRRALFFKPVWGFGSRGTYKGAKLTKKTWSSILQSDYVAQQLIAPSERLLVTDGTHQSMKVDVRCYVYRGEIQLIGARMYRGQTTNFRTDGGGLTAVFTTP